MLLLALCASPLPAEGKAAVMEVPKGTILAVETIDPLSSAANKPGDAFRARLTEGVWVRGRVALPPGTTARGVVTEAVASGRVSGRAKLSLTLQTLDLDGKSYSVASDTLSYVGEPHGGKHWGSGLMGALQGALYGVLFGGKDNAILGAAAGAGAGAASSIFKGKLDVSFEQGSKLMFETGAAVTVPEPPPGPPATTAAPKWEMKPEAKPEAKTDGKKEPEKKPEGEKPAAKPAS